MSEHVFVLLLCLLSVSAGMAAGGDAVIDLSGAGYMLSAAADEALAATAAAVLSEEVTLRTGLTLAESADGLIRLVVDPGLAAAAGDEGFSLVSDSDGVIIRAASGRGLLYGAGCFLRRMAWGRGKLTFPGGVDITTRPAYPLRGHQLGYRDTANSWDAWTPAQYDRYIRELALFGANAIENIPFQDNAGSPHMKLPRDAMNRVISGICAKYGLEYWCWTPATFNLSDADKRAAEVEKHAAFYRRCPRLDAIFFPGGDPGHNHPRDVMPFLAELAPLLDDAHPGAKIWLSLQGFDEEKCYWFLGWLKKNMPAWFGGVVAGPGSPPIPLTRELLPAEYPIRHYPDITHCVRCQYPVQWWDPAFAKTLGREPINPQPVYYGLIHNAFAPYTCGFLTYSDGVHDDVNKTVWTRRGWNPAEPVNDILRDYCRFFFGPDVADAAADGILALEKNWEGPLPENGGITAALGHWQGLEKAHPELAGNWRWQMCLLRACYDAYTRYRLLYEQGLEAAMNRYILDHLDQEPAQVMETALAMVNRAEEENCRPVLRRRIDQLCAALFETIGLQTSKEKYQASGYERGCILDFVDYPLNNRWWLEDEFAKLRGVEDAAAQRARLRLIATWENPGEGSFYDDIGAVGRCPHVLRGEGLNTDPAMRRNPNPEAWWWDEGFSRTRLSWQSTLDFPKALVYEALDPDASYALRLTGYGDAKTRADSVLLDASVYGKDIGAFKVFPIPRELTADGSLRITWDELDESHLNWRQQSRISEAWLLRQ
jgi:hypothetical protein